MQEHYCPKCDEYFFVAGDECPLCGDNKNFEITKSDIFENPWNNKKKPNLNNVNVWKVVEYDNAWSFIEDANLRRNIAYNVHYVAQLLSLHHNYDIYGSFEKSIFKTIIITIGSIIEASLISLLNNEYSFEIDKQTGNLVEGNNRINKGSGFTELINTIDMKRFLPLGILNGIKELKEARNTIHLTKFDNPEYKSLNEDIVNKYLLLLSSFWEFITKEDISRNEKEPLVKELFKY